MTEQIYTFSDEEIARMFRSGEMKVLTTPNLPKEKTEHEKALEKAKELFGRDFEDVFKLEIGGKSVKQLKKELVNSDRYISVFAQELMSNRHFYTSTIPHSINIVKVKVLDLGFREEATMQQIYHKAQELGLQICPPEVGPRLRLKDADQPPEDWYMIAMEPIPDRFGVLSVFILEICPDGLVLDCSYADIDIEQNPSTKFVFRI